MSPEVRADLTLDASDAVGIVNQLAEDIDAALSNATLNLDTSGAEADINALGSETIDIPVAADTAEASADINALGDAPPVDVPVTAETGSAQAEIDSLGAEPIDIPVTVDTGDATQSISDLTDEIADSGDTATSSSGGMSQFGTAAAETGAGAGKGAVGIIGLTAGLAETAHLAIDAATSQQHFNQVFGDMRGVAAKVDIPGIKGTYVDLAKSIGISAGEIQNSLVVAFQLATNVIGLSGPPAVDYAKKITDIALNLKAQGLQTGSVDSITRRLSLSLEGSSSRLARMGVHIDDSAVAAQVMTNQLSGLNDELGLTDNKAKTAFARVQIYTFEAGNSIDHHIKDKAKQSQTQVDKMRVSFENFLAKVVVPVVVPALDWLSKNGPAIVGFIQDHFPNIVDAIKNVIDAAPEAWDQAKGVWHDFQDAFGSVGSAAVTGVEKVRDFGQGTVVAASAAASAIADAGHKVVDWGGDTVHAFGQAATSVHDFTSNTVSRVADMASSIGDKAHDIANRIGDGFTNAKNVASDAIGTIKGQIGSLVDKVVNIVVNVATGALDHAIDLFHTVVGFAGRVVSMGTDVATGAVSSAIGLFNTLWGFAGRVVSMGSEVAHSAIDTAISLAEKFIGFSGKVVSMSVSVATGAIDTAISLVEKLLGFAGKVVDIAVHVDVPSVPTIDTPFGKVPYASGGPIGAGTVATVGEQGREIFVPATDGVIIPNGPTEQILGGGGFDDSNIVQVLGEIHQAIVSGGGDIHVSVDGGGNATTRGDPSWMQGRR